LHRRYSVVLCNGGPTKEAPSVGGLGRTVLNLPLGFHGMTPRRAPWSGSGMCFQAASLKSGASGRAGTHHYAEICHHQLQGLNGEVGGFCNRSMSFWVTFQLVLKIQRHPLSLQTLINLRFNRVQHCNHLSPLPNPFSSVSSPTSSLRHGLGLSHYSTVPLGCLPTLTAPWDTAQS
jgi:hypothetical protein